MILMDSIEISCHKILSHLTGKPSLFFVIFGNAKFFFRIFHNGSDRGKNIIGQRLRFVSFQNFPGLLRCFLIQVVGPRILPLLPNSAVDQTRLRLAAHVLVGTVVAEEIIERSDLPDDIHRQSFVIDGNPIDSILDHSCKFIIHHQLAEIESDSTLKHSQTVDYIGTCQCR